MIDACLMIPRKKKISGKDIRMSCARKKCSVLLTRILRFGLDELADEVKSVKRQELITPGRRGEQIKHEEISREILRRLSLRDKAIQL